jgi:hypothetical protein
LAGVAVNKAPEGRNNGNLWANAREMRNALAIWPDHIASIVDGVDRKVINFPTYQHVFTFVYMVLVC